MFQSFFQSQSTHFDATLNCLALRKQVSFLSIIESYYAHIRMTPRFFVVVILGVVIVIVFMQIFTYAGRHTFHAQCPCGKSGKRKGNRGDALKAATFIFRLFANSSS